MIMVLFVKKKGIEFSVSLLRHIFQAPFLRAVHCGSVASLVSSWTGKHKLNSTIKGEMGHEYNCASVHYLWGELS